MQQTGRGLLTEEAPTFNRQAMRDAKRETLRSRQRIVASQCQVLYTGSGVKATEGLSWGAFVQRVAQGNRDDLRRSTSDLAAA